MTDTLEVAVAIGNSDDKLTQAEWSRYMNRVEASIRGWATTVHGVFHTEPKSIRQSMAVIFEVRPRDADNLRNILGTFARDHKQDSIVWLEGRTEFIRPL